MMGKLRLQEHIPATGIRPKVMEDPDLGPHSPWHYLLSLLKKNSRKRVEDFKDGVWEE